MNRLALPFGKVGLLHSQIKGHVVLMQHLTGLLQFPAPSLNSGKLLRSSRPRAMVGISQRCCVLMVACSFTLEQDLYTHKMVLISMCDS